MKAEDIRLIVGLGNPGCRYQNTRHNLGFMVLDKFIEKKSNVKWKQKNLYQSASFSAKTGKIHFLKPLTFMNLSGVAVERFLKENEATPGQMMVLHDDKDIEAGELKIRWNGGDGGHKGIRSIIKEIGTSDFFRLKVGVGGPPPGLSVTDYVLRDIDKASEKTYEFMLDRAAEALEFVIFSDVTKAMNRFNRKVQKDELPGRSC